MKTCKSATKLDRIKIPNNKGMMISVAVHHPKISSMRLAILCPGYLDSKDYDHIAMLEEVLSDHGYTTVRFDPTGTGESEGSIGDYLTSQYLEDIRSVIEYMLKESNFKKVLLCGHSRGGMVSILYAARDLRISTVVAIMPSSPKTMTGKRYRDWKTTGFNLSTRDIPSSTKKREYRVPYGHVIDRQKFDVFKDVKDVHVPIVLVAGEFDKIVYPEDVKEIYDRANEPKKYILMKGIGHGYRRNPEEVKGINEKIIEAILENI
jgi:pimeloyl-ACP methyl ester carboxylesterase